MTLATAPLRLALRTLPADADFDLALAEAGAVVAALGNRAPRFHVLVGTDGSIAVGAALEAGEAAPPGTREVTVATSGTATASSTGQDALRALPPGTLATFVAGRGADGGVTLAATRVAIAPALPTPDRG